MASEKVTSLNEYKSARRNRRVRRSAEPTQEQIDAIIDLTEKIWLKGEVKTLREAYEQAMDRLFPWWR